MSPSTSRPGCGGALRRIEYAATKKATPSSASTLFPMTSTWKSEISTSRRVGTAILFESSGGQTEKVAHLPELRFALGEPQLDTTSIDNAALVLEGRSYFVRKTGADGFRIGYQPTMKKVVSDRRAALDEDQEVMPAIRKLVEEEFRRGASISVVAFPGDGTAIPDTPRLNLVVADPAVEWSGGGAVRAQIAEWTRQRGTSPRLYPRRARVVPQEAGTQSARQGGVRGQPNGLAAFDKALQSSGPRVLSSAP